jgi:hypothetical protein
MNMRLTKAQYEVKRLLVQYEGSVIVRHRKITGTECYRLLTFDHNPVANMRRSVLHGLVQKGVVMRVGNEYMINPVVMEKRKAAIAKRRLNKELLDSSDNPVA